MFLCEPCLRRSYTNTPSIRQSLGHCENCQRFGSCSDIPSLWLHRKPPRPKKRSAKNAALDARARVRAQASVKKSTPLERMDNALKDED
jgi:hypothetical protein